jgi:hypothetical protein
MVEVERVVEATFDFEPYYSDELVLGWLPGESLSH